MPQWRERDRRFWVEKSVGKTLTGVSLCDVTLSITCKANSLSPNTEIDLP